MTLWLADPEAAALYQKDVQKFNEEGGFLTAFSGALVEYLDMYETAHMIQRYQDFKKGMATAPLEAIGQITKDVSRNKRELDMYLNGLDD